MKLWHGVVTGVVSYLFFILAGAPAGKLLPLLHAAAPGIHLAGVEGTVWTGAAAVVQASPVQLQQASWSFRPLGLLLGRAEFAVQGQLRGRPLSGRAGRGLFGGPYLSRVQGSVAAADVLSLMQLKQLGVDGVLAFDLADVQWSEARLPAVSGSLSWSPARVTRPVTLELGQAQLEAHSEEGVTRGTLDASGGALLVQGDVQVNPDGAYRLEARLQQKGEIPPEVAKFLATFTEYKDGSYLLEWSDTL